MRKIQLGVIILVLTLVGCTKETPKELTIETEDEKTFYALGQILGRNTSIFGLSERELAVVQKGMSDYVLGNEPLVKLEEYGPKVDALAKARGQIKADQQKAAAGAYLETAAKEEGAVKTASGLIYKELKAGDGDTPTATDTVKVHYRGTLTDGTEFDSSYDRGPTEFPLNRVIKCWTEGIQRMKVGGKAKLVCPADIAYGDRGHPPTIPGGATLVFEVELLEIVKDNAPDEAK